MNDRKVKLSDIYDVMVEMLESGGTVNFNPNGTSMLPTIMNHGDRVILKKVNRRLKKYELPLYRRSDGTFVLHRVVRVYDDCYGMCGDNQWHIEKGIKDENIIGVVIHITRKGREIDADNWLYKIYVFIWVNIMPLRHIVIGGKNKLLHMIKKIPQK